MATLLYHLTQDDGKAAISPFDEAVLQVARSGPVRIVSPYIGVAYLERIISLSPEWRLISDVQEWLGSLSAQARPRAWQFIREHLDLIHHCPALHAKAVISDSLAMMGSANLTQMGILGRTEMGILLDDSRLVGEMNAWFEDLWVGTAPPIADEASAYIQWLDEEASHAPARRQRFALSSGSRKVRARLVKLETKAPSQVEDAPLDLSQVAQAVIVQDQRHYDSLEAALEAAVDKLTAAGAFTFGQLAAETRRGFTGTNLREIYILLVQHCANHVRSVFVEATANRLILREGQFEQSTREMLPAALAPFDAFLFVLVGKLNFHTPAGLPTEEQLERDTGFGGRDQVILVSELLDVGFLMLDDRPGELPHYTLDGSFEGWEGRFRFFGRAHAAWLAKQKLTAPASDGTDQPADIEVRRPATAYGVLRGDQLPEVDDDAPVQFDLDPTWVENRAALRQMLQKSAVVLVLADKAKKQATADLSVRGKLPGDKAQRQLGYVDTLLSRLLGMLGNGKTFVAPNTRGAVQLIRQATGNRPEIIEAALNAGVVRLARLENARHRQLALEINPALSWPVLAKYPKTSAACAALLGDAPVTPTET